MASVTVREVQHHFSRLLRRIEAGEELQIVRRNRPVAKLSPIERTAAYAPEVDWSDLPQRRNHIWKGRAARSATSDEVLQELRGDR